MSRFTVSSLLGAVFAVTCASLSQAQVPTTEIRTLGLSDDGVTWTELTLTIPVNGYVIADFNGSEVWVFGSQFPPDQIPLISAVPDYHCSAILSMYCCCEKSCYENDNGRKRYGTCIP
jgi:hypothetical protein